MLSPLELLDAQLKLAIASKATFPMRWKGSAWDNSIQVNDGDMPVGPDGEPVPAMELETSSFSPKRNPGEPGKRQTIAEGFVRMYLSVESMSGLAELNAEYGRLDKLSRETIYYDDLTATRIYLMDVRVDEGAASYEEGNRTVRMLTVPYVMSWIS